MFSTTKITTLQMVKDNVPIDASFMAYNFNDKYANDLSIVLKANTSISRLDLSLCQMTDDQFRLLAEAIVVRDSVLSELNLNYNDLTETSLVSLRKIFEKKKVTKLFIFDNPISQKDSSSFVKLNALATETEANIITHFVRKPSEDVSTKILGINEEKEQTQYKFNPQ